MVQILRLYMDDSGTRHPDRNVNLDSPKPDWFALGGILVRDEDEDACRSSHAQFISRWGLGGPLHSEEIRNFKGCYGQFRKDKPKQDKFFADLQDFLLKLPVTGIACVIDRPGYHRRYDEIYGKEKWLLCRTAFQICVERAAKFAIKEGRKLDVYVERSDKKTDKKVGNYFQELRQGGHSFDAKNAAKYAPLGQTDFASCLYDFRLKDKKSELMQVADLYLYPMVKGGYPKTYTPFEVLRGGGKLIDAHVEDHHSCGIKYSCFEGVKKVTEGESEPSSSVVQPSTEDLVG